MRKGTNAFGLTPVLLTTALCAGLFTLGARPARAVVDDLDSCVAPIENGYAFFSNNEGATSLGQEVALDPDTPGKNITPEIVVKLLLKNGQTIFPDDDDYITVVPQGHGFVDIDHRYHANPNLDSEDDKALTAYNIVRDPCDHTTHVFTVVIKTTADARGDH